MTDFRSRYTFRYRVKFDSDRLGKFAQPAVTIEARDTDDFLRRITRLAKKTLASRDADVLVDIIPDGTILGKVFVGSIREVGRFTAEPLERPRG